MPSTNRRMWRLARRPLLLALVLGFGISLIVSGRFTVRLIADGALSFAFVPLAELAGFALVYRFGHRTLSFAEAVDGFFAGNTPWLWWLLGIMTATVVYGRNGQAYGDRELLQLAAADGRLPKAARPDYSASLLERVSQVLGLAGLVGLILFNRRPRD